MRPPLRSIDPWMLPVSMATRGEAPERRPRGSLARRRPALPPVPATARALARRQRGAAVPAGCATGPAAPAPLLGRLLLRLLLALLLHLRHADRSIASRSARRPRARWRGWCSYYRSSRIPYCRCASACTRRNAPSKSSAIARERQCKRRASADQHIIMSGPHPRHGSRAARFPAGGGARGYARRRCRPSSTR